MKLKKILSMVTALLMLTPVNVSKAKEEADYFEIPITLHEVNACSIDGYFTRRGIPLKQGQLYDADSACVVSQDDKRVYSQCTATETYSDGSIKWLNTAIVANLKANELINLKVTNRPFEKLHGDVSYNNVTKTLSNSDVSLKIGLRGIESLKYKGAQMLDGIMNMYAVTDGKTDYLKADSIEIIKSSDIFARIRVRGKINKQLEAEYIITLSAKSALVDIEYRITPQTDITIQSTGIQLIPSGKVSNEDGVINAEYIRAGMMNIISYDNTRFCGAVTRAVNTGFVKNNEIIRVAPIVNNTDFIWYDGVTRTNHLYLSFGDNEEKVLNNIKKPPELIIDTKQFVKAGQIETDEISPVVARMIEGIEWLDGRMDGIFDAGAIPYRVDLYSDVIGVRNTRPGEVEYHIGYGYMMTGSNIIYNILQTSAEDWADVEIYKGGQELIVGANRYKTADGYGSQRFFTSHPFYGDPTGLYMAYVLSGNEYLGEVFKTCVDYIYKIMYAYPNSGENYPRMFDWNSKKPNPVAYVECRYLIQAKGQYLAYNLFHESKYREASLAIAKWGKKNQSDEGYLYQAYYDDATPFIHGGQSKPPVKNYVMLYGFRGITDVFDYEVFDVSKQLSCKMSDWICLENEKFGQGLWRPCGDMELYPSDEDGGRGKEGKTDIMAVSVLYNTYKITGNERYLKNMLSLLEAWICEQGPGGICLDANYTKECSYGGGIGNLCGGMNYTLLKIAPALTKFIKENSELVYSLGYEDLVTIFSENAEKSTTVFKPVKYVWPEMQEYAYKNGDAEVLLDYNVNGFVNSEYDKQYETVVCASGLWQGTVNKVSSPYEVTLSKYMKHYDYCISMKRPIYVDNLTDALEAEITDYDKDKIRIELSGSGCADLRIESGKFAINKGDNVDIMTEHIAEKTVITVTHGKNYTVDENGNIVLKVNLSGAEVKDIEASFASQIDFAQYSETGLTKAIKKITGKTVEFSSQTITHEQLAEKIMEILKNDKKVFLAEHGIQAVSFTVPAKLNSVSVEVEKAADALELDTKTPLDGDMELPHVSLYNTSVSWTSENPEILSADGVLDRKKVGRNESVRLTATVYKNGCERLKTFDIKLNNPSVITWNPSGNFPDGKHILYPKTGDFEWTFTLVPQYDSTNALLSITDTDLPAGANSDWPIIVRLNPNGYFDAYNYSDYQKEQTVNYEKHRRYNFRVVIRGEQKKYDVYVTPDGGEEILIARDYTFRSTAKDVKVFDVCYLISNVSYNDCFTVTACNLVYPVKYALRSFKEYDDFGLLFGKYISGDTVSLRYSDKSGRINWISDNNGAVDAGGRVRRSEKEMLVTVYGLCAEQFKNICFTDIAKSLGMFSMEAAPEDAVTQNDARKIIKKLHYIYQ